MSTKRFPRHPSRPEGICWGCDQYCPSHDMRCGNGSVRTLHPMELFGPDWDAEPPVDGNAPIPPPDTKAGLP